MSDFQPVIDAFLVPEPVIAESIGSENPHIGFVVLDVGELDQLFDDNAAHLITPFAQPDSASVIDFGITAARDFAPERTQKANVYEAVAAHLGPLALQAAVEGVVPALLDEGAVVGPAQRPGVFTLASQSTLLSAVVMAGGPAPNGSMRKVLLRRDGKVASAKIVDSENRVDLTLKDGEGGANGRQFLR